MAAEASRTKTGQTNLCCSGLRRARCRAPRPRRARRAEPQITPVLLDLREDAGRLPGPSVPQPAEDEAIHHNARRQAA